MSTSKGFVPPFYGKFAKNVKDLFKKKYDFDHTLKVVHKADKGLTIESGAVTTDAALKGYGKAKYASNDFGEFETEIWTAESNESKATLKLSKLAKGLNLTLGASTKDKDATFKRPVTSADFEYSQDNVAFQTVVKTDFGSVKAEESLSVGSDGISVGGAAVLDFTNGFNVVDYNAGFEYSQKDVTATVFTEKSGSVINAGLYQKPSTNYVVGALFKYDLADGGRSLVLGSDYKVDDNTQVRGKLELPKGTVSAVIEQKLNNPAFLFQVAAQFGTKPTLASQKLGLSVSLGDF